MPRKVGYGRPGTRVIPRDWAETNGRVIESTLDCLISIAPPGAGPAAWNAERGQSETTAATPVYAGLSTITPISEGTARPVTADAPTPVREYEVKLPRAAAGIAVDQHITVTTSTDTALPAGSVLRVTSIEVASRRFSRILRAVPL